MELAIDAVIRQAWSGKPGLLAKYDSALAVMSRALALYSPHELSFSFNGGKDSTVLLHLLRVATAQRTDGKMGERTSIDFPDEGDVLGGIRTFFFFAPDDFPAIREFTQGVIREYGLRCTVFPESKSFKQGVQQLVNEDVRACIIGTRKGDPNADGQSFFCPSSQGWPPFMRINPILDWEYQDVWAFLLATKVGYCSLYDEGYTSIGAVTDTLPNVSLKRADGSYAPAYDLVDGTQERNGRAAPSWQSTLPVSPVKTKKGSVGICIVGSELLSGKVADANISYLCKELSGMGFTVSKVCIVPDAVPAIATELRRIRADCEVVLTAGGTGPTLDDNTISAIAEALDVRLTRHPALEARLRAFYGDSLTDAHLKMAQVPKGVVDLIEGDADVTGEPPTNPFPLLRCDHSIYVLPGVPHLLVHQFGLLRAALANEMTTELKPFVTRSLLLKKSSFQEGDIAEALSQAQLTAAREYPEQPIAIGSYPVSDRGDVGIVITVEGRDPEQLAATTDSLKHTLEEQCYVVEEEA